MEFFQGANQALGLLLESWTLEFGPSLKALEMRVWETFHLVGEAYVEEEKSSITPIAIGHGTHTSSTAAGGFIENASLMGLASGLARGGAPSSWLAIYKVCWATGGCSTADLLAAFDDAIFDGVDMLSVPLGSRPPLASYVEDVMSIGSFHAVAKGISVVCSAGNSGPYSQTIINSAPRIFTVAASTIDMAFPTAIFLGHWY